MTYQPPPGAPGFPPPGQPAPYPQPQYNPQQPPYAQPPQAPYAQPPQAPYNPQQPPYAQPPQAPYAQPPQAPYNPQQPPYAQPPQAPYAQNPYGAMPQQPRGGGRPQTDPLAGFDEADPTGSRLPHFNADRSYVLENTKIEFFQGRNDDFINLEFTILESDDPMLSPGRAAKYMIKMGQDMSMPNFKSALGALMGYATKEEIVAHVTEAVGRAALSDQQPMKGKRVHLNTTSTTTRQNKPFTVHNWTPASPATSTAPMMPQPAAQPQLPYHPQAGMMGQGYQPNMAPPQPFAPQAPAAPPPAPFPPVGWYAHPGQPGAFHNTKETISEADLRARMAQGRA